MKLYKPAIATLIFSVITWAIEHFIRETDYSLTHVAGAAIFYFIFMYLFFFYREQHHARNDNQ
jgi:hypothetical protein